MSILPKPSEQEERDFERWSQQFDSRTAFIQHWLRFKYHCGDKLPTTWQEAVDWLTEFDKKRNEFNIAWEKMFFEHMTTCLHPIIINPKDWLERSAPESEKKP